MSTDVSTSNRRLQRKPGEINLELTDDQYTRLRRERDIPL
jgi:hypothetical protein